MVHSPLPLNSNRWALLEPGHLSERSDRARETATEDLALWPRYGEPAEARFTGLAGVALFMDGELMGKGTEWRGEEQTPKLPLYCSLLPSSRLIPLSTPLCSFHSSHPIRSQFNLPVDGLRAPRPATTLVLFIKATGCELACP